MELIPSRRSDCRRTGRPPGPSRHPDRARAGSPGLRPRPGRRARRRRWRAPPRQPLRRGARSPRRPVPRRSRAGWQQPRAPPGRPGPPRPCPARRLDHDLVVAHGGDAFKYLALRHPDSHRLLRHRHLAGSRPTKPARVCCGGLWSAGPGSAPPSPTTSRPTARGSCGGPMSRIVVIPNGRDADALPTGAACKPRPMPISAPLRRRASPRASGPTASSISCAHLREAGLAVRATMVGDGPLRRVLETPTRLPRDIEVPGFASRRRALPAGSRRACLPERTRR